MTDRPGKNLLGSLVTGQGDQTAPETSSIPSVRLHFVVLLSVLFIHNVLKGGRLHCILWLRPESARWFVRSKYLNTWGFLFSFLSSSGREGVVSEGFWKYGWICSIQVGYQHTLKYMHVRTWTSFYPLLSSFSFSPYRSLGRGEDSRHRKNVAKLLCAFKPKCLHNFFCLSTDKSIVDISAPKFWCFFKNRCHRWECPTLAGLTSTPFRERSLGKQVVFGLLASLLPTRDVVII